MTGILDLLRGTVRLKISGPRPERMLNLMAKEDIRFARPQVEDGAGISFTVLRRDLGRTRQLAAQAYFESEILRHGGIPTLSNRLKSRAALFSLLPLCMLVVFVLSLFIWEIDVSGSETLSEAQILAVLEEHGVGIGTFGLTIDRELLRDRVIADLPALSWMTVNVSGCKAHVIVRERVEPPAIPDPRIPADIIAEKTGLICEMSVFDGERQAEKGDTVLQGELLISGTMPSLSGKTRQVRSQGVVKARTWYEISLKIPLEYISKRYTGETVSKKSLNIGNYRVNLYLNGGIPLDDCDKIIYRERLSLPGGMPLPIETITAEYREYIAEPARMSAKDAEAILKPRLIQMLSEQTKGEPLSLEFETTDDGNFAEVTLRAECMEDIGLTVPIQKNLAKE